jgi:hypothetical protein
MAKIYIAMINKSWWHTGHPIEVLTFELPKIASGRRARSAKLDQASVFVTPN